LIQLLILYVEFYEWTLLVWAWLQAPILNWKVSTHMLGTCLVRMLELIGCANFKGYGCIEEVKGHVDGRAQDEDLFTLLVNSVGKWWVQEAPLRICWILFHQANAH